MWVFDATPVENGGRITSAVEGAVLRAPRGLSLKSKRRCSGGPEERRAARRERGQRLHPRLGPILHTSVNPSGGSGVTEAGVLAPF